MLRPATRGLMDQSGHEIERRLKMAESWKQSSSSMDSQGQDVLCCGICMETYDEEKRPPKFLNCHHTYCEACLLHIATEQNIECPSCRQLTPIQSPGVPNLQTNFYLVHMRETLKKMDGSGTKEKGCSKHSNQPLSFFCQKCIEAICRDCTVLEHKERDGHEIQDISEAELEQRMSLNEEEAMAQCVLEEIESHMLHLEAERHNLRVAKEMVMKDIATTFDKYSRLMEVRKLQLTKQLTDLYNERQSCILSMTENLQKGMTELHKTLGRCSKLLKGGSLGDVVLAKTTLQQNTGNLKDLVKELVVGKNNLVFDSKRGEVNCQSSIGQVGHVFADDCLPSRVSFDVPEMTAGLPTLMLIQVFSYGGEKISGNSIDVVVYDPKHVSAKKTVTCEDTGNYKVLCTPQTSGEHKIIATFRGQPIKGAERVVLVASNDPVAKYGSQGSGEGKFKYPRAIAVDEDGSIFVADTGNRLIQKLDKTGEFLSQFCIDSGCGKTSTCDLSIDRKAGTIVITETSTDTANKNPTVGNTVAIYSKDGILKNRFSHKVMRCALCVATNSHSEIIVSDYLAHGLFMFNPEGTYLRRIGNSGYFNHPSFICVTPKDEMIISDTNTDAVEIFERGGHFVSRFGKAGSGKGEFKQPFGVAYDGDNIVVVDSGNSRIQVFRRDGELVFIIESTSDPLNQPRGIALTDDGHVYVADRDNHCIKKYKYQHRSKPPAETT